MDTIVQVQKEKSPPWFLIFLFIAFPYVLIIQHFLGDIRIFGNSPVYLIFVFLLAFYFLFILKKKNYYFQNFLIFVCLIFIVLLLRLLLGVDEASSGYLTFFEKAKWMIFTPVIIALAREIFYRVRNTNIIMIAIIVPAIISALSAIMYNFKIYPLWLLFGNITALMLFEKGGVTRAMGIWGSSNLHGAMLILGLWVLFEKKKNIFTIPLAFILYYGILLSISRFSIIFASILILYYLFLYWKNKRILMGILLIVLIVSTSSTLFRDSFNLDKIYHIYNKVDPRTYIQNTESGSLFVTRISKNLVGLKALFSKPLFTLLGSDMKSIVDPSVPATEASALTFSDNSFIEGMLEIGIPVFFYFLYVCKRCFGKNPKYPSLKIKLFLIYTFITLLIYNSILWDVWIFYAVMLYFLLNSNQATIYKIQSKN